MTGISIWLDSEACPACGTGLHCTADRGIVVTQLCPACGWTAASELASQAKGSR